MKKHFLYIIIILMGCQTNSDVDLGGDYRLIYSSGRGEFTIVNENNVVAVGEHVLEYSLYSNYIVASQRPWDSIPECTYKVKGTTLDDCIKSFRNSTFKQYWIIDKNIKEIYGPYKREQYLIKFEELGLSDELLLDEEI